jgi:hypothetical protein
MTWMTLALIVIVFWCVVSVVVGFAVAHFFGGMTRLRPDEAAPGPAERICRQREGVSERFPRRRVKAPPRAGDACRPAPAGGAPDPPLEGK